MFVFLDGFILTRSNKSTNIFLFISKYQNSANALKQRFLNFFTRVPFDLSHWCSQHT